MSSLRLSSINLNIILKSGIANRPSLVPNLLVRSCLELWEFHSSTSFKCKKTYDSLMWISLVQNTIALLVLTKVHVSHYCSRFSENIRFNSIQNIKVIVVYCYIILKTRSISHFRRKADGAWTCFLFHNRSCNGSTSYIIPKFAW